VVLNINQQVKIKKLTEQIYVQYIKKNKKSNQCLKDIKINTRIDDTKDRFVGENIPKPESKPEKMKTRSKDANAPNSAANAPNVAANAAANAPNAAANAPNAAANPSPNAKEALAAYVKLDKSGENSKANKICDININAYQPVENVNSISLNQPFTQVFITGDGNCLFNSFSNILFGNQSYQFKIRQIICDWIDRNMEDIHFPGGKDTYIRTMRKDKEWGTSIEIGAFVKLSEINIVVYTNTFGKINEKTIYNKQIFEVGAEKDAFEGKSSLHREERVDGINYEYVETIPPHNNYRYLFNCNQSHYEVLDPKNKPKNKDMDSKINVFKDLVEHYFDGEENDIKSVSIRHIKEMFDLFKSGNHSDFIKKLHVMEKMGMINKDLKELIVQAIPALIFLKSFKTDDNSYSDNYMAYINKIKYTCYMKQSVIEFNKCAKDTSINLLSIFVEGSFNTIKKFIEVSYDKKHTLHTVSTVIGTFTTEDKKEYTKLLIDGIKLFVNSLRGIESEDNKEGWSLKSLEEKLNIVKGYILGILKISKKIIPAINDNEVTIKFVIDTVFEVIKSAVSATGKHLLINQFVYAYADNLSNEKSDIYKNIKEHDHLNTLISFIRIAINSLPTLILKYFQLLDEIMKDNPMLKEYWIMIVGPKLKYPVMGKLEYNMIAQKILKGNLTLQKATEKVGKLLFPASVGQVHLYNTTESLKYENKDFETKFKSELQIVKRGSTQFELKKFMYLTGIINEYKKQLKSDKETLKKVFDEFKLKNLNVINRTIFEKLNWVKLKKDKPKYSSGSNKKNLLNIVEELYLLFLIEDKNDFYATDSMTSQIEVKLVNTGNVTLLNKCGDNENSRELDEQDDEIKLSNITLCDNDTIKCKKCKKTLGEIFDIYLNHVYRLANNDNKKIKDKMLESFPVEIEKIKESGYLKNIRKRFNKLVYDKNSDAFPGEDDKKLEFVLSMALCNFDFEHHLIYEGGSPQNYPKLKDKAEKMIAFLTILNDNYSTLVQYGVDQTDKYYLETTIKKYQDILAEYLTAKGQFDSKKISIDENIQAATLKKKDLQYIYESNKEYIKQHQKDVNAVITKSNLTKYVIKFVKIRSRMALCMEKAIIPDSVKSVVEMYTKNAKIDPKTLEKLSTYTDLVSCKIKDVTNEFDLWEELINTNEGKSFYEYPEPYSGLSYDELDGFCIKVADILKTFDANDGIKPLYVIEDKEQSNNFTDFNNEGQKINVKRGFYTAMIQELMPGKTVGNLEKTEMPQVELDCMKKAVLKYISKFIVTIIINGRYHGDPHPGNIMWDYSKNKDGIMIGQLSVIDFGDWVSIDEDKRMALLGLVLFLLAVFYNPFPKIWSDKDICDRFANMIVKFLRIDKYENVKLKNLFVKNRLYVNEDELANFDEKIKLSSRYKERVVEACNFILKEKIGKRLYKLSKDIVKNNDNGDLGVIFSILNPKSLDDLFKEFNKIDDDPCTKFGKDIYKLIESIGKLYGFKKYLDMNTGDILDLFFSIVNTIILNDKLQICEDDKNSYLSIVTYLKLICYQMFNIQRKSYLNNVDHIINSTNVILAASVLGAGYAVASTAFSGAMFAYNWVYPPLARIANYNNAVTSEINEKIMAESSTVSSSILPNTINVIANTGLTLLNYSTYAVTVVPKALYSFTANNLILLSICVAFLNYSAVQQHKRTVKAAEESERQFRNSLLKADANTIQILLDDGISIMQNFIMVFFNNWLSTTKRGDTYNKVLSGIKSIGDNINSVSVQLSSKSPIISGLYDSLKVIVDISPYAIKLITPILSNLAWAIWMTFKFVKGVIYSPSWLYIKFCSGPKLNSFITKNNVNEIYSFINIDPMFTDSLYHFKLQKIKDTDFQANKSVLEINHKNITNYVSLISDLIFGDATDEGKERLITNITNEIFETSHSSCVTVAGGWFSSEVCTSRYGYLQFCSNKLKELKLQVDKLVKELAEIKTYSVYLNKTNQILIKKKEFIDKLKELDNMKITKQISMGKFDLELNLSIEDGFISHIYHTIEDEVCKDYTSKQIDQQMLSSSFSSFVRSREFNAGYTKSQSYDHLIKENCNTHFQTGSTEECIDKNDYAAFNNIMNRRNYLFGFDNEIIKQEANKCSFIYDLFVS
jgi:hypothetical protein